jgi:hypothetical protein
VHLFKKIALWIPHLNNLHSERNRYAQEIQRLELERDNLQLQIRMLIQNDSKSKLNELTKNLISVSDAILRLYDKVTNHNSSKTEVKALSQEISRLSGAILRLDDRVTNHNSSKTEVKALSQEISRLSGAILSLDDRVTTHSSSKMEVKVLSQEISSLLSAILIFDEEVKTHGIIAKDLLLQVVSGASKSEETIEVIADKLHSFMTSELKYIKEKLELKNDVVNYHRSFENRVILHVNRKINALLQRTSPIRSKIKVLFCVYYRRYWSSLEPIYLEMLASEDFEPIAVALADVSGLDSSENFNELCDYLASRNIKYIKWGQMNSNGLRSERFLIENISPDIVFKQTHWDANEPDSVHTDVVSGYRVCYVPYGMEIAEQPDVTVNQDLHQSAWRIFTPSEIHVNYFKSRSLIQAHNVIAVGHPRLDLIAAASLIAKEKRAMEFLTGKLALTRNRFRVLWAPHHSVGSDWLRFGTFHFTSMAILDFVRKNPDITFVLREHHILYEMLVKFNLLSEDEVKQFVALWESLGNTEIDRNPSYIDSFSNTDVLLTDGVSFLAEYQVTQKPIIFIERFDHMPFTEVGEYIIRGVYRCDNITIALEKIIELKNGLGDNLDIIRKDISAMLMPFPNGSAGKILQEIRNGLQADFKERFL